MDTRSAPDRLRRLASWLINQNSIATRRVVSPRIAQAGAGRRDYLTLAALEQFGATSQASLGRRLGLDRSDVAAVMNDLDEHGLIERARDPKDHRRNSVAITRSGKARLLALDKVVEEAQDELLAPLDDGERRQLLALLTRLADHHAPPS